MTDLIRKSDALALFDGPDTCPIQFDYGEARDRIAALPAVTVGVRPLVWEDFGDWGAKASAYYQANYLIQFWKGREQFEVALSYPGYQTGFDGERWHPTLAAAKAAAQADYAARILAALPAVAAPDHDVVEIDLRAAMMEQIEEAASQSPWVPPEYMMNEIISDCCTFLREARAPDPAAIREAALREAAALMAVAAENCRKQFAYPPKTKEQRDYQTGAIIHSNAAAAILALIPKGAAE